MFEKEAHLARPSSSSRPATRRDNVRRWPEEGPPVVTTVVYGSQRGWHREVKIEGSEMTAFIRSRRSQPADRNDQRPERFQQGRKRSNGARHPSTTRRPARSRSRSRPSKSPKRRKRSPPTGSSDSGASPRRHPRLPRSRIARRSNGQRPVSDQEGPRRWCGALSISAQQIAQDAEPFVAAWEHLGAGGGVSERALNGKSWR